MTVRYPVVLFDFDHTLFDFEASKAAAFAAVVGSAGDRSLDELLALFKSVERPLWAQLEAGDLTLDTLNDRRFAALAEAADLDGDPADMAAAYLVELGRNGRLLDGARPLLERLSSTHALGLVSNGYGEVMHARLANYDLARYFDTVVVSSEVGVAKPDPRFLDVAFEQLGQPDRASVLMVGDSLTSDMAAADRYGIDSCWYNPGRDDAPPSPAITYTVDHLDAVEPIVR